MNPTRLCRTGSTWESRGCCCLRPMLILEWQPVDCYRTLKGATILSIGLNCSWTIFVFFCSYWKHLLWNNKCHIPLKNLLECRNWWSQILVMIWESTVETDGVPWEGDHFKNITIWPAWSSALLTLLHVQKNYKVSGTVYFSYLAPVCAGKLRGHATWLTHTDHCRTNPNHPSVDYERFMVTQRALVMDQVSMGIPRVCKPPASTHLSLFRNRSQDSHSNVSDRIFFFNKKTIKHYRTAPWLITYYLDKTVAPHWSQNSPEITPNYLLQFIN